MNRPSILTHLCAVVCALAGLFVAGGSAQPIVDIHGESTPDAIKLHLLMHCPYPMVIWDASRNNFLLRENGNEIRSFSVDPNLMQIGGGPWNGLAFGFGGDPAAGYDSCIMAAHAYIDFGDGYDAPEAFGAMIYRPRTTGFERTSFRRTANALNPSVDTLGRCRTSTLWDYLYGVVADYVQEKGLDRSLILFTDGIDHGSTHSPEEIIALADQYNLQLFPVAYGGNVADSMLWRIALQTGGYFFRSERFYRMNTLVGMVVHENWMMDCGLSYQINCNDGKRRNIEVTIHDIPGCPEPVTRKVSVDVPLDTVSLTDFRLSVGTVRAQGGDTVRVPLVLETSRPGIVAPFTITLSTDTNLASFVGEAVHVSLPDSIQPLVSGNGGEASFSVALPMRLYGRDTLAILTLTTRVMHTPEDAFLRFEGVVFHPGYEPLCLFPRFSEGRIRIGGLLTLISPQGGEVFCRDGFIPILWSGDVRSGIQIEVSNDGGHTFGLVAEHVFSTPYYWTPSGAFPLGNYIVRIQGTDPGASDQSPRPISLQKNFDILQQPSDDDCCAGAHVTFRIGLSASNTTKIQWQRSMDEGQSWMNITQANSRFLSFNAGASLSGALFRVVTTNVCGAGASNPVRLWVYGTPRWLQEPSDLALCEGDSVFSSCIPDFRVPPDRIQWQMQPLGSSVFVNLPGDTLPTLRPKRCTLAQDGTRIRALLYNPCDTTVSRSALMTVIPKTAIIAGPASLSLLVADSAMLRVTAAGRHLRYQWLKDGTPIPGAVDSILRFPHVGVQDEGSYSVIVEGDCGAPIRTDSALIRVALSGIDRKEWISSALLLGAYPNPFSSAVVIRLQTSGIGDWRAQFHGTGGTDGVKLEAKAFLKIYDLLGRELLDLTPRIRSTGEAMLSGNELPGAGVYIIRAVTPAGVRSSTIVHLR